MLQEEGAAWLGTNVDAEQAFPSASLTATAEFGAYPNPKNLQSQSTSTFNDTPSTRSQRRNELETVKNTQKSGKRWLRTTMPPAAVIHVFVVVVSCVAAAVDRNCTSLSCHYSITPKARRNCECICCRCNARSCRFLQCFS